MRRNESCCQRYLDTSPISNLIVIDRLDLLKATYGHIIVPFTAWKEIIALENYGKNLSEFRVATWIEMVPLKPEELLPMQSYKLDLGEKEAITLARIINADLLLIDEKIGREVAKEFGIKTTGLLGTLVTAKVMAKALSVKKIMDELKNKAGFWIANDLYQEVLKLSGEL